MQIPRWWPRDSPGDHARSPCVSNRQPERSGEVARPLARLEGVNGGAPGLVSLAKGSLGCQSLEFVFGLVAEVGHILRHR